MSDNFNHVRFNAVTASLAVQLYDLAHECADLHFSENFKDVAEQLFNFTRKLDSLYGDAHTSIFDLRQALAPEGERV